MNAHTQGDHMHLDGHALGVMAFLFFLIILGYGGGDWGTFNAAPLPEQQGATDRGQRGEAA